MIPINSVLIALAGQGKTRGTVAINKIELCTNQSIASIIPDKNKLDYQFLYFYLESKYEYLRRLSSSDGGRGGLNLKLIKSVKINIPSINEQKRISSLISLLEVKITLMEKNIYNRMLIKKYYINQFYKNDFNLCPLKNYIKQINEKNKNKENFDVLSINNKKGFIKQKDQFGEHEVASSDKHNYKIINNGNFAYNPSRINVGSIAKLEEFENGIISPMYVMFDIKNNELTSNYLKYYFESETFKYHMLKRLEGSVRQTLSFKALANIPLNIPDRESQEKISNFLFMNEKSIKIYKEKLELNKNYKKTLLSKMFC